jgi:F0F1-type ATP synthase assembly protein I
MKKEEIVKVILLAVFMVIAIEPSAFAITAPAAGSFAYDVYDMAVNSILKGPIGFVAGLAAVCFGAALAIQQKIGGAIPALLGGAVLLKADTIVSSMGLLY